MPDELRDGLTTLSEEVEAERYVPGYDPLTPADLDHLTRDVTTAIEAGLSSARTS